MKLISIKYCGGCNPVIDRGWLASEIGKLLSPEFTLSDSKVEKQSDIGILVCGCLTACANNPDMKKSATKWIVVAGHSFDQINVPENQLVHLVVDKLSQEET